jgi:hypothetical protein
VRTIAGHFAASCGPNADRDLRSELVRGPDPQSNLRFQYASVCVRLESSTSIRPWATEIKGLSCKPDSAGSETGSGDFRRGGQASLCAAWPLVFT